MSTITLENDSHTTIGIVMLGPDYATGVFHTIQPGQVQTWDRNTTGVFVINKPDDPVGEVWTMVPGQVYTFTHF